jgi:hypothetical protein
MKTKIEFSYEYKAVFEDVARLVAKGDPPPWLPIALSHLSAGIGEGPNDEDRLIKQTTKAIDHLLRFLPAFDHLGFGVVTKEREDARAVLVLLPGIRDAFERGLHKDGRRPDVGKQVCAVVMIEAWTVVRGSVKPHSKEFKEACVEYWKACGGGESDRESDLDNWRRAIESAMKMERGWIRKRLTAIVQKVG